MEAIQHKFFAYVTFRLRLPPPEVWYNYQQIATLRFHEKMIDLYFLCDLVNSNIDCSFLLSFLCRRITERKPRRSECIASLPNAKTNRYLRSPLWCTSKSIKRQQNTHLTQPKVFHSKMRQRIPRLQVLERLQSST